MAPWSSPLALKFLAYGICVAITGMRNENSCDDIISADRRKTPETRLNHPCSHELASGKDVKMRKLFFSMCAVGFALTAIFVWSHTVATPVQAYQGTSINPADISANYTGPLPVEQWDAI